MTNRHHPLSPLQAALPTPLPSIKTGVGLVRDPLLLSLPQTLLPWKLVGTGCHLKGGVFLDQKPSRNPPMIQEALPSNLIRVLRSHPQWSWCVLRLLEWQRIQSPSSHPKWTFQSQKGGNSLHIPIISNLGIWMCLLQLDSRKSGSGVFRWATGYLRLCFPDLLCCSKIGISPFQLSISEKETAVAVLNSGLNWSLKNSCTHTKPSSLLYCTSPMCYAALGDVLPSALYCSKTLNCVLWERTACSVQ